MARALLGMALQGVTLLAEIHGTAARVSQQISHFFTFFVSYSGIFASQHA
jgi:hypothetical protein